jgi:tetratricopeptide (TPR) repeat protein
MRIRNFFHRHVFVAAASGAVLILASHWFTHSRDFSKPKMFNLPYQLTAPFFRFVSGGFWPAMADALWIKTLERAGESTYSPDIFDETQEFYRLATDLDPNFYELYEQGGVLFSIYFEKGEAARDLLLKGISVYEDGKISEAFWTHPATLYLMLAYTYAFQLGDWKNAKATYLRASQVRGAPAYLYAMKKWLESENSEKILAKKVLTTLINNSTDPGIKKKYEEKLKLYE